MKKISIKITVFALMAVLVVAGVITTSIIANAETWSEVELQSSYAYGTTLEIPSATCTIGGQQVSATSTLIYPNGTTTGASTAKLNVAGKYELVYSAMANNSAKIKRYSFFVNSSIAVVGENSNFSYGHPDNASTDGLMVNLKSGETLEFPQIIDLNTLNSDDKLLSFYVNPFTIGSADFDKVIVKFTDIENSRNFFTVNVHRSGEAGGELFTYLSAQAENQPYTGWEQYKSRIHVNNAYGTITVHSFSGDYKQNNVNQPLDSSPICLQYNTVTKTIYVYDAWDGILYTIVDFDDTKFFATPWEGFTSGKVRVSVSCDGYTSNFASFVVTDLFSVDLSQTEYVYSGEPQITVNTDYDQMPDATLGVNYLIPSATAKDDNDGNVSVQTEVFFDYGGLQLNVPIIDGKFNVSRIGNYSIVYTATNSYGITGTKVVNVKSQTSIPQIDGVISNEKTTSCYTGEKFVIPQIDAFGGSGKLTVKNKVTFGTTTTYVGDTYRPEKSGTYTVTYEVSDYIGQVKEFSYQVQVTNGSIPVLYEEPVLPMYFICNNEHILDEVYAVDYSTGVAQNVKLTIKVTDSNGIKTLSDNKFTPCVQNNGDTVKVEYFAGANKLYEKDVKTVVPYESSELVIKNYLVSDDCLFESNGYSTKVSATNEQSSWTFANKLLAGKFALEFSAIPNASTYQGLKITLTDSVDRNVSVTLFIKNNGNIAQIVTANKTNDLTVGFSSASLSNNFVISFNESTFDVNTAKILVDKTDSGAEFNGFKSGFVYVTATFVGADNSSAYLISKINNQPITNEAYDFEAPQILVTKEFSKNASVGDIFTIPVILTGDVLSADATILYTLSYVHDDKTEVVTAQDGTVLRNVIPNKEYSFKIENYGTYRLLITVEDSEGNDSKQTFSINVIDTEAPTITFRQKFQTQITLGEFIKIPDYTVKDNYSTDSELSVSQYIETSSGYLVPLANDTNAYKPINTGSYNIIIIVKDAAGNTTYVNKTVVVVE